MKKLIFNNQTFYEGEILKVTYIENRFEDNSLCTNTFQEFEVLKYEDKYGFYLQTQFEDIPFIRIIGDNRYPNLIYNIEKAYE